MILLLNTTKTMDLNAMIPSHLETTEPDQMELARILAEKISKMSHSQLIKQMSISEKLAAETSSNAALWGRKSRPKIPALFCFTGLLYKSLDASTLNTFQLNDAQKRVRILSGLYGLLRPFDLIEAYRLEMGQKMIVGKAKNIVTFWKKTLTAEINKNLKVGEPIISLSAQEYIKALDHKKLNGPVISPVFKEQHIDGTCKTVVVHAKKARGELVRYALVNNAQIPQDLMGFNMNRWKVAEEAPKAGPWLFTRPVT